MNPKFYKNIFLIAGGVKETKNAFHQRRLQEFRADVNFFKVVKKYAAHCSVFINLRLDVNYFECVSLPLLVENSLSLPSCNVTFLADVFHASLK